MLCYKRKEKGPSVPHSRARHGSGFFTLFSATVTTTAASSYKTPEQGVGEGQDQKGHATSPQETSMLTQPRGSLQCNKQPPSHLLLLCTKWVYIIVNCLLRFPGLTVLCHNPIEGWLLLQTDHRSTVSQGPEGRSWGEEGVSAGAINL